jgi:predicted secreted protein
MVMRGRAVGALMAFALAIGSLGGCGGGAEEPDAVVDVDCAAFDAVAPGGAPLTREVTLGVDDTLQVTLCSNPSTGFAWEDPTTEGDATLEALAHDVVATDGTAVGTPTKERFGFKATGAGSSVIHFTYSQPWAGGIKGAWALDLAVTVE